MYARLQMVRSLLVEGRGDNSRRLVDTVRTHPRIRRHWFDGPRSAEQQAADELSGTRIKRALQSVDGLVVDYVLRRADGAMVVAAFACSIEAIEAIEASGRAIMSSELLPGEDPVLLAGPDRTMVCGVDALAMAPATV